ncbi:single-stranded DNA-binding protein [Acidiluteibacter ferrifornacis]|uniref:Single-stranded DNA-binding protein n=1 Tax=Acidiluteibacter ferrifornacis TaxID=2692424 RepID=A0A6N9NPQ9_9FLAO|nr:single-stranded DNA-binding protein [Acidiluteibacter ferrifornacis]MBR9831282.1 single-stranded DNA-binding protein [bacterium]NBG67107.1 single-stranded DNA-binding protein [Acidiluteibacter ferrifornacis]
MSSLRNNVQLIGNLGAKPEVKHLEGGKVVANMSIATTESYKNAKGEKVQDTTWHQLVMWGKTAEIAEKYLDKGSEVAISGKLTNRSYEDKEGVKRYITEVLVSEIVMFGSKS